MAEQRDEQKTTEGPMENAAGPFKAPVDREAAKTRALARLRQAIWDASQYVPLAEISGYCDDVCGEIANDEP